MKLHFFSLLQPPDFVHIIHYRQINFKQILKNMFNQTIDKKEIYFGLHFDKFKSFISQFILIAH